MRTRLLFLMLLSLGTYAWSAGTSTVIFNLAAELAALSDPITINAPIVFENSVTMDLPPIFGGVSISTKTTTEIRAMVCDPLPCVVLNVTDYDLYTATGTAAGNWRNTRLGTGP